MKNFYENVTIKGFETVGFFDLCIEVGFRGRSAKPQLIINLDNEKYFWTRPVDFYASHNGGWTVSYGSGGEEGGYPEQESLRAKAEALLIAAKIVENLNAGEDAIKGLVFDKFTPVYES